MADRNLGDEPYFLRISTMSVWSDVSKALTKSAKTTYVSRLCWRRRWRRVFSVQFPSWQPLLGVAPNWYLVPCVLRSLYALAVSMRLKILDPTSIRLMIRYWLGLSGWGTFWIGTPLPSCHSGKSDVLSQKLFMKLNVVVRWELFMALKASAGMLLAPGDLLFVRPLMALVNSFHVIGSSRVVSSSCWCIRCSAIGETVLLLLNMCSQCGRNSLNRAVCEIYSTWVLPLPKYVQYV